MDNVTWRQIQDVLHRDTDGSLSECQHNRDMITGKGSLLVIRALNSLERPLRRLNAASDAVHNEIIEFDKSVSSEIFEWWQDAMNMADQALPAKGQLA